ncbi:MAG: hypothetical protein ABIN36_17935 [Ferruginibacter sp.]
MKTLPAIRKKAGLSLRFWESYAYIGAWLRPYEIETKSPGFNRLEV